MTEKSVVGVCPECKVRHHDLAEKPLQKCSLCERYFCSTHANPKLAFYSARFHVGMIKDPQHRKMVEDDFLNKQAHPCVPYTKIRIKEVKAEYKKHLDMIDGILDKSKESAYIRDRHRNVPKRIPREPEKRIRKSVKTKPITHERRIREKHGLKWATMKEYAIIITIMLGPLVPFILGFMLSISYNSAYLHLENADFINFYLAKIISFLMFFSGTGWLIIWCPIPIPVPTSFHSLIAIATFLGLLILSIISYAKARKKGLILTLIVLLSIFFMISEPERIATRDFQTINELTTFLHHDNTNTIPYTSSFTCIDFSLTLIERAKTAGYRIYFASDGSHAFCQVYIVGENDWVYIEPQTDEIW